MISVKNNKHIYDMSIEKKVEVEQQKIKDNGYERVIKLKNSKGESVAIKMYNNFITLKNEKSYEEYYTMFPKTHYEYEEYLSALTKLEFIPKYAQDYKDKIAKVRYITKARDAMDVNFTELISRNRNEDIYRNDDEYFIAASASFTEKKLEEFNTKIDALGDQISLMKFVADKQKIKLEYNEKKKEHNRER